MYGIFETIFLQISGLSSDTTNTLIAIGTMILAGTTAYYAFQTRKTVNVMEKSAQLSIMPHIKGHLIPDGAIMTFFRISNVGNGPANNITLKFWLDASKNEIRNWSNNLLMPNDHEDFILTIPEKKAVADLIYFEKNQTRIQIQGIYYDMQGKEYSIDETLDVTKLAKDWIKSNQKIRHHDPLSEIVDELEQIKNIMQINHFEDSRIFANLRKSQDTQDSSDTEFSNKS